jgi:hypothetical protein
MRINQTLFKKIMRDEARRTLREAFEAHDDDLIQRAYTGGGADSAGPTDDGDRDDDNPPGNDDTSNVDDNSSGVEVDGEEGDEEVDQVTGPEDESDEGKVRKSLMEKFNDSKVVDFGLDVLGTVAGYVADAAVAGSVGLGAPVAYTLAAVPDLLNSIRHASRGERGEAAIYFLCALPIIGEVLGPVKISMKVLGTAARAGEVYDVIKKIRKLTKTARASRLPVKTINKIKKVCDEHFPSFDIDETLEDAKIIMTGTRSEVDELFEVSSRDYTVSTEADPIAESRRRERTISIMMDSHRKSRF